MGGAGRNGGAVEGLAASGCVVILQRVARPSLCRAWFRRGGTARRRLGWRIKPSSCRSADFSLRTAALLPMHGHTSCMPGPASDASSETGSSKAECAYDFWDTAGVLPGCRATSARMCLARQASEPCWLHARGSAPGPGRCRTGCERPGYVKCSPSVLLLISRSYAFTSSNPTVRATSSSRHSGHQDGSGAAAGPGRRGRWIEGVR